MLKDSLLFKECTVSIRGNIERIRNIIKPEIQNKIKSGGYVST
jgi:hypothetical protein